VLTALIPPKGLYGLAPVVPDMDFDHEQFGVHVVEFSLPDAVAEGHYSVVLRMNALSVLDSASVELSHGLPAPETAELLLALRESCERALRALVEAER